MTISGKAIVGILNTITGKRKALRDGFHIRWATVERRIPCLTSLDTARAALKALTHGKVIYSIKPVSEYLN